MNIYDSNSSKKDRNSAIKLRNSASIDRNSAIKLRNSSYLIEILPDN